MAHIFSAYVVVDWSASSKKKLGKDSIWYSIVSRVEGNLEERMVKNVPTRKQLVTEIVQFCEKMQANRQNIFVGWDFSFGFPAGFYEALDLETLHDNPTPKWASIWDFLDSLIVDKDDNSNNRFQVAAEINRMVQRINLNLLSGFHFLPSFYLVVFTMKQEFDEAIWLGF